jgi:hypothetical protein
LGMELQNHDKIKTSDNSKAQITFEDNTVITIGKNSLFEIDDYLYNSTNESHANFNVISGTIRIMSGKIGKVAPERFKVITKTATIGIRGTNFTVNVEDNDILSVFCLQGIVDVFDPKNHQSTLFAGSFLSFDPKNTDAIIQEIIPEDFLKFINTNLNQAALERSVKSNLHLSTLIDNIINNTVTQTLFNDTFETNTLPILGTLNSGEMINIDESI